MGQYRPAHTAGLERIQPRRKYRLVRPSSRIRRAMSPSEVLLESRVADSTVTVVPYAPFQVIRPHAHEEEGLTIVLQGTFLEEAQSGTMLAGAGSVATRPYGLRHTNRFGPEGAVILAVIPDRDRFGPGVGPHTGEDGTVREDPGPHRGGP